MKKLLALFCVVILATLSGCCVNLLKPKDPTYTAEAEFLFTNGVIDDAGTTGDATSNNDVAASINLMPTIRAILSTDGIKKEVYEYIKENTDLNITQNELKNSWSIEENDNRSLVVTIVIETDSQNKSDKIIECVKAVVPQYVEEKINGCKVHVD